jgi:hypothetical protein
MEKIVVIGDVHGLRTWEQVVEKHPNCKYVFLGDYNDPYGHAISDEEVLDNFRRIIDFKLAHMEDVVLLLGNHDMHYKDTEIAAIGSRYNVEIAFDLMMLYDDYSHCFQNAHQEGKLLFTHAGVSEEWFVDAFQAATKKEAAWQLNHCVDKQEEALHRCGVQRGGPFPYGGIFWADKTEFEHPLQGYVQIAGHNRVDSIEIKRDSDYPESSIMFCDCLQYGKYLVIDFTKPEGEKLIHCSLKEEDL